MSTNPHFHLDQLALWLSLSYQVKFAVLLHAVQRFKLITRSFLRLFSLLSQFNGHQALVVLFCSSLYLVLIWPVWQVPPFKSVFIFLGTGFGCIHIRQNLSRPGLSVQKGKSG